MLFYHVWSHLDMHSWHVFYWRPVVMHNVPFGSSVHLDDIGCLHSMHIGNLLDGWPDILHGVSCRLCVRIGHVWSHILFIW
jgi:hypothetical protein